MASAFLTAALALTLLSASAVADDDRAASPASLEIVALANEGALLRAGETTVAIDAAITEAYPPYGALPPEAWRAMLAGEPPFEDLDLLLVSHPHPDHFDAEAAAQLLRARPLVRLVSSPPVVEAVRPLLDEAAAARQLEVVAPAPGEAIEIVAGDARIRVLRLRHGGRSYEEIWNLAHVIELGGARALHIGDAEGVPATFERYDLPALGIDVALLPYWIFEDELADGLAGAPTVVALHVPPAELDEVRADLAQRWPDVVVPSPMEPLAAAAAP